MDAPQVENIRRLSYAAYVLAKDSTSAERLKKSIISSSTDPAWTDTVEVAFQPLKKIRDTLIKGEGEPQELVVAAEQLQRSGDLNSAGVLFLEAANKAKTNREDPIPFARKAYQPKRQLENCPYRA